MLDWVAKWRLIKAFLDRGVDPDNPKLAAIDIQYADIDPAKSLYHALVRKGQMRTLVTDAELERASVTPPRETRAYFRGRVTEKFGDAVVAASWQNVTLRAKDSYVLFHLDEVDAATGPDIIAALEATPAGDVHALLGALAKAGLNPEYRHL